MRALSYACCLITCLLFASAGCQTPVRSDVEEIEKLSRGRDSVQYELSLRQKELDEMEATAKKPGVVGVSNEWLRRRDELKEKITALRVRLREIDNELAAPRSKSD